MTYVIANVHGMKEKYETLLDTISFSEEKDLLYVLGDIVDYGEDPIGVLTDMSMRPNVFPIVGEHDYRAARLLSEYDRMQREGKTPGPDFIAEMSDWVQNGGGAPTVEGFMKLDNDMKEGILDYLGEMALYEEVTVKGETYLLVHAGVKDFSEDIILDHCTPETFLSEPLDFEKEYTEEKQIIAGHTPVTEIPEADPELIYYGNGSIALDCGAAFGGKLACLCLDNGKEYYI